MNHETVRQFMEKAEESRNATATSDRVRAMQFAVGLAEKIIEQAIAQEEHLQSLCKEKEEERRQHEQGEGYKFLYSENIRILEAHLRNSTRSSLKTDYRLLALLNARRTIGEIESDMLNQRSQLLAKRGI